MANTRLENEIRSLEQKYPAQETASEVQLTRLFERIRTSLRPPEVIDAETKRKAIQALIHQVVITRDRFKMHF